MDDLLSEYSQLADQLLKEEEVKSQKVDVSGLITPHSAEVTAAVKALEKLKKVLDPSSAILQVSVLDIESSFELRQSLIDEAGQVNHLFNYAKSLEFEKEHDSKV